jgi:hypothetical protein
VNSNKRDLNITRGKTLRPGLVPKIFCLHPSYRMFRHIHGVLNVDEKKLIAQFLGKSRDESFKPN